MKLQGSKYERRRKWNCEKLDDDNVTKECRKDIVQKLAQKERSQQVEEEWQNIKQSIVEATEVIIAEKKNQRNDEWYDEESKEVVRLKTIARQTMINRDTRTNRDDYVQKR
jgi:hypothetical protein